jgi:hypothetical protein
MIAAAPSALYSPCFLAVGFSTFAIGRDGDDTAEYRQAGDQTHNEGPHRFLLLTLGYV